jgi:hypothetical protein
VAPPKTKTDIGTRAPTREIGAVLQGNFSALGMAKWTTFVDDYEYVPDLVWPNSVRTYDMMRTDSQLAALYRATALAIRKMKWTIDPNDAPDEMVKHFSEDYNLPILGESSKVSQERNQPPTDLKAPAKAPEPPPKPTRLRLKNRFSFNNHLRLAMLAGIYGHYYFEQVGKIGDDGKWHLRKLAERPPRTIQDFRIAEDGGLVSIIQNVSGNNRNPWMLPEIPVDNLVAYVNEQEGANWAGRSWFRDCYKNWLIKDRLIRIDAVNHERAGGVPYIEAHPGATPAEIEALNKMAQGFRIGDTSGGAVPSGAKLNIAKGTNSSVIESIKYHDEAMARYFMLMIMQLGQTVTGSRALGNTFVEFWADGLSAIADWIADTFNEHVIEDDVDWNWGPDEEKVPKLAYEVDPILAVEDLKLMIDSEAIIVDDELEFYIRKEMGLPDKGAPRQSMKLATQLEIADKKLQQGPPGATPPGAPSGPGKPKPAPTGAGGK